MIIAWVRKFFKINLLFVFVLSILSCTGERGKSEMMSFEDIISKYFESYDPIFESSIRRPGNHAGTILIDKKKLSNVEMDEIKNKIKSDGWVEMENTNSRLVRQEAQHWFCKPYYLLCYCKMKPVNSQFLGVPITRLPQRQILSSIAFCQH